MAEELVTPQSNDVPIASVPVSARTEFVGGTILWFNVAKDIGVITSDDGERLSVHGPSFAGGERPNGRSAGTVVSFRVVDVVGERRADEVRVVPEMAPRRARLRQGRSRSR